MGRVMSYPARRLRKRRREWMRSKARLVVFLTAGLVVMGVAGSVLLLQAVPAPIVYYVLGALHVGLIAAGLHLVNAAFLAQDQEAIWQLRGAWGEDNTRGELQRAKRERLIWGSVDSVSLQGGDIDHIVVTCRGGVVALDSKWRNQVTRADVPAMAAAANRAARRTQGVLNTVLTAERGARHRAKPKPVPVTPAVVLWGSARIDVPDDVSVDGVRFVDGGRLLSWLRELDEHEIPQDAAQEALRLLADYRSTAATKST